MGVGVLNLNCICFVRNNSRLFPLDSRGAVLLRHLEGDRWGRGRPERSSRRTVTPAESLRSADCSRLHELHDGCICIFYALQEVVAPFAQRRCHVFGTSLRGQVTRRMDLQQGLTASGNSSLKFPRTRWTRCRLLWPLDERLARQRAARRKGQMSNGQEPDSQGKGRPSIHRTGSLPGLSDVV